MDEPTPTTSLTDFRKWLESEDADFSLMEEYDEGVASGEITCVRDLWEKGMSLSTLGWLAFRIGDWDCEVRSLACATARGVWDLLIDPASREAVEAAEAYLKDGHVTLLRLARHGKAWKAYKNLKERLDCYSVSGPQDLVVRLCRAARLAAVVLESSWELCFDLFLFDDLITHVHGKPAVDVLRERIPDVFADKKVRPEEGT